MNTDLYARLAALGDPTRVRLLLVLDRHELTVGELCSVLQLPQSTVSRHLKVLADDGWLVARADGTSRQYRVPEDLDAGARRLWRVVREQAGEGELAQADGARAAQVLAESYTAMVSGVLIGMSDALSSGGSAVRKTKAK